MKDIRQYIKGRLLDPDSAERDSFIDVEACFKDLEEHLEKPIRDRNLILPFTNPRFPYGIFWRMWHRLDFHRSDILKGRLVQLCEMIVELDNGRGLVELPDEILGAIARKKRQASSDPQTVKP